MTVNNQYKDTPLWIRGNEEIGYFTTLGNHKVSTPTKTIGEQYEKIEKKDWNLLLTIITSQVFNITRTIDNERAAEVEELLRKATNQTDKGS